MLLPSLLPQHWCVCVYVRVLPVHPQVTPGSPAEKVGLRPTRRNMGGDLILGDIIKGIDGSPVESVGDLLEKLDAKRVGDTVVVDVLRGRQPLKFSVQLADRKLGSGTE